MYQIRGYIKVYQKCLTEDCFEHKMKVANQTSIKYGNILR